MTGRQAVELMLQASQTTTGPKSAGVGVTSLDHVTFVVKDLERSRHFYEDVLGMRSVPRPAFSFAGSWFQSGRTQVHLILEYAGSGPAGNLLASNLRTSRTLHAAFAVEDAHAAARRLGELGVPLLDGPKPRPDGYVQVFVEDPDGHVIELCSPPKG
jgi:catechol 2,3-dioxygenase-like lactoylglutathione lyase family enzyme